MCDDYYYYEEQRKAEAKSEAALAGTFATAIGGIVGAVLSCALFLVRRFDILSSGLASLLFYMLTYTQEWNKVIYRRCTGYIYCINDFTICVCGC